MSSNVVADFLKNRTKRTLRIDDDAWSALQEIAAKHGHVNKHGRKVGFGNVGAMLEGIARGSLFVGVGDDCARRAIERGENWREVCT